MSIIQNKRALHDFEILEQEVAGMVLTTPEVKSIAAGKFSISGCYVRFIGDEAFLINDGYTVKLLMKRQQLNKFMGKVQTAGLTIVPIEIIKKNNKFKLVIGLARGKKEYDKRAAKKQRDTDLENRRIVKSQKMGDA